MKLNTKLGIGKKEDDDFRRMVIEDQKRRTALEERIVDLIAAIAPKPEPQEEPEAPEPAAPKPSAFALDVRRREDGLIKEVKALDAGTGLLYYTFDVRRDSFGSVTNIAAVPREV